MGTVSNNVRRYAETVYNRFSGGNAGFVFSKRVDEEFYELARKGNLNQKTGKDVISQYVRAEVIDMARRGAIPLTGAPLTQVFRLALNHLFSDYKENIRMINQEVRRGGIGNTEYI